MEIPWLSIFVAFITIALALKFLLHSFCANDYAAKLPPGPFRIPILTDLHLLHQLANDFEGALRKLHSKYGPIIYLKMGPRNAVFISNNDLAHKAFVQNGAIFADRPPFPESAKMISSNQRSISFSSYNPLWRILRRNLTSEILHPHRMKSFAHSRKSVLSMLIKKLKYEYDQSSEKKPIKLVDHFQYAMYCMLVYICYGDYLGNDKVIRNIEKVEKDFSLAFHRFHILGALPLVLSKIVFRSRWSELLEIRKNLETVHIPVIRARKEKLHQLKQKQNQEALGVLSYLDTLLNLTIPEESDAGGALKEEEEEREGQKEVKENERRRKLTEDELVTLCSEFLQGSIHSTTTSLQWIMANLVKHQEIQERLFNEITSNTNADNYEKDGEIKEEDLQKLPYLKAVVLEGLRRHPPAHFLLPHTVTEDVTVGGYVVKKGSFVNVLVAEIGWDPTVWEDPMEFKPERFLSKKGGEAGDHHLDVKSFDIMGSREIKMMPFGAGRRICPGLGLALLNLEYFVCNLVREFKWTAAEGYKVDLSETMNISTVMKYPLQVHVTPRN